MGRRRILAARQGVRAGRIACQAGILTATVLLGGCGLKQALVGGGQPPLGEPAPQKTVVGFTVAPTPEAANAAKRVLDAGGNAADAATAAGFALAVTLPSRAGLGGGGACLIDLPKQEGGTGKPVALMFPAAAPKASATGSRPAAVPMLARGLIAMQAKYGALALSQDVAPAEAMAAGGVPVSQRLAQDLKIVGPALLADPGARAIFAGPSGQILQQGQTMQQPDLATTLSNLQANGLLGFYHGDFAQRFVNAADSAGGALTTGDLAAATPRFTDPVTTRKDGIDYAFTPGAGGVGAREAAQALLAGATPATAEQRGLEAAKQARHGASLDRLPASSGFAVADSKGGVVGCATSMNNLFGTGRVAAGTGILLAASPRQITPALLPVGLATRGGNFKAIATGSGQKAAPEAAAEALINAVRTGMPMSKPVPSPGRANAIACKNTLPGDPKSCSAGADPRDGGLALSTH